MCTSQGDLLFSINGESQGIAAIGISKPVWAVISLFGKCTQVTLVCSDDIQISSTAESTFAVASASYDIENIRPNFQNPNTNNLPLGLLPSTYISGSTTTCIDNDRLYFHARCGSLVNLSANNRTAERRRPLDEFNNGVVMTHRPLKDNELFEIRIDKLVDKWSGSIEGIHHTFNGKYQQTTKIIFLLKL